MEMLSETCGVSNSDSKRHLDVFNVEKVIRDHNDCSTSARYSNSNASYDTIVITPFSLRRCRRLRPVAFPMARRVPETAKSQ